MADETVRVATLTAEACRDFARDNWSLQEAERIQDRGLFLYLQDILIVDAPVWEAPLLSSSDHLNPHSEKTRAWWDKARSLCRIDRKLEKEMRVFCDPLRARDAREEDKLAAQLQTKRIWDADDEQPVKAKRFRGDASRDPDAHETEALAPSFAHSGGAYCQVICKGLGPSGASVVWRINGWRPFFFVLMESNDLPDAQVL